MNRNIFVDDELIEARNGVERQMHAATKLDDPVMVGDRPWESAEGDRRIYVYGTVLAAPEGGYRMWYNHASGHVLYAVSEDGIVWEKPALGLVEYEGSTDNNILPIRLHSTSVVEDDTGGDARYKMLGNGKEGVRGYFVAHSPDGLDWHLYPRNPVIEGSDTCTLAFDREAGEYLAFHKLSHDYRGHRRRLVYLATSTDMQSWSDPVLVMAPDETDDAMTRAEGGICSQFYNMSAFAYGGQWLGLVTHFRYNGPPPGFDPDNTRQAESPHDGPIDVQLVHSRDGRAWHRTDDRSPVIANGPHRYDAGSILGVSNTPLIVGDEIWCYYTAITTTHAGHIPAKEITIARASWRIDGWVSLHAGADSGFVETVALRPGGSTLRLNAAASSSGEVLAEVLDEHGRALAGYAASDCVPLTGDDPRAVLRWRSHDTLPRDRQLKIRFHLQHAHLYSWWADDGRT